MHSTITNREEKSFGNVLVLGLAAALVGGVCVPGMAQPNTQNTSQNAASMSRNNSVPVANISPKLTGPSTSASTSPADKHSEEKSATGLSSRLPTGAQGPISAALGKDDSGYWVHRSAAGFRGENPRQKLVAQFTRKGAEVVSRDLHWRMETRGYGYGDALHRVRAVGPQANANQVEYRRDEITEWYENGPLGLEQGFTLAHPPGKRNGQSLALELDLRGDLVAALEPAGSDKKSKSLELRGKDGKVALRYTGLSARDATGRELQSWLEMRGERLLVRVEDREAQYPVVIDPWIQQAELTASDGVAHDWFGISVAVSGSTVVVGAYYHTVGSNPQQGAAYVFAQNGTTWSQQAELTASDGKAGDNFGNSVAISGSTAVVGAPDHAACSDCALGAAYVFVQSGETWSQQAELTASDGAAADFFGYSVAVSGSTAVVGALNHTVGSNSGQGAAYVFAESAGAWTQQVELTASDGMARDAFGFSVAVSGSTVVVGAPAHPFSSGSAGPGAAYVFVQSDAKWSQQAELTASDGAAGDDFGFSVAVSGSTAVVGAPDHQVGSNYAQGAVYVFVEGRGAWSQQTELTASDGMTGDIFGTSAAVSGSTALVGASLHTVGSNQAQGAAYVFVQNGGTWNQQAEFTASDGVAYDDFGFSIAVSDGIAAVGTPTHPYSSSGPGPGAAYVFVSGVPAATLSPTSLSFGNGAVNNTSAAKTVTLKNTGTATLDVSDIAPSADFAVSSTTCGSTLAAGKTCKVGVTFTPTKLGSVTGTLSFTDNASGSPQTVSLSGTGVEPATLTPPSATFPKRKVGTTSAVKTFTLTNNQTVALTSIAISTTGDFAVSATTCETSLAAKKSCTISVTFTPESTGTLTGELNVSDSASNSPQTASLTGTGD